MTDPGLQPFLEEMERVRRALFDAIDRPTGRQYPPVVFPLAEFTGRVPELGHAVDFGSTDFVDSDWRNRVARGSRFSGNLIQSSTFMSADLCDSRFVGVTFESCRFKKTALEATFRNVTLVDCDFQSTRFSNATFDDVRFERCRFDRPFFYQVDFASTVVVEADIVKLFGVTEPSPFH